MKQAIFRALVAAVVAVVIGVVGRGAAQDQPQQWTAWAPQTNTIALALQNGDDLEVRLLDTAGDLYSTTTLAGVTLADGPYWNDTGLIVALVTVTPNDEYAVMALNASDPTAPILLAVDRSMGLPVLVDWSTLNDVSVVVNTLIQTNPVDGISGPVGVRDIVTMYNAPDAPITALAWSPFSNYLLTAQTEAVLLWRVDEGGNFTLIEAIPVPDGEVDGTIGLAWQPTEAAFAVGFGATIHVYTLRDMTISRDQVLVAGGEGGAADVIRLLWRGDALLSVAATDTGAAAYVFNTTTWQATFDYPTTTAQASEIALSPDGTALLLAVEPASNALSIDYGVNVVGEPLITSSTGQVVGPTQAEANCSLQGARLTLQNGYTVADTPHELSLVIVADGLVYGSVRFTFTSGQDVGALTTVGLPYFLSDSDPQVPAFPLAAVAGEDLPAQSIWTLQLRNLDGAVCASAVIDYDCVNGVASITENTTTCVFDGRD